MCIAAVIFNKLPYNYLQAMEESNPHGGGVAWEQDGGIQFLRGLTAKDIYDLQEQGVFTYPYLLHFRWATHGGITEELTHPFPIGPRALMGETAGKCDKLMIHNGTWSRYETEAIAHMNKGNYDFPEEILSGVSDTAIAAWLAAYDETILDDVSWATAVAVMRDTVADDGSPCRVMDITTRGTWTDKEGNWYSNLNWLPWESYSSYSGGSGSDYIYYKGYRVGQSRGHDYSEENYDPSAFSGYDIRDRVGVRGDGRTDENRHWQAAVSPHGWRSITEPLSQAERDKRAEDPGYIGKYNDICVMRSFYDKWYPEKDCYKPDNVGYKEWYDRFTWENLEDGKGSTQTQESAAKDTVSDGEGQSSESDGENSPSVSNRYPNLVSPEAKGWFEYLRARYGDEAATTIADCFPSEESAACGRVSDPEGDENETVLQGWERSPKDPDWLSDDDLISDDPEMVNAWLSKRNLVA